MKKKVLSLLCALSLTLALIMPANALVGESKRAADTLAAIGFIKGDYALDKVATQEQAATLIVRLLGEEKTVVKQASGFPDVPKWAQNTMNFCAANGIILPNEYTANSSLTADLWCAMLLRALGYGDVTALGSAALTARRIGLISQPLEGELTRGKLFESLVGVLSFPYRSTDTTVLDKLIAKGVCSRATAEKCGLLSETLTARQVADRYMSAVFCLALYHDEEALESGEASANASGFFISADGLAVTNYHSIADAISGTATLVTGEELAIDRVIFYDKDIDIAVIRISSTTADGKAAAPFNHVELVGREDARVGDVVYTISNPLGLGLVMSSGILGSTSHEATLSSLPCFVSDATISQGSSGGALFNECGQILAVTTGAYTYGNNMYLGVPVDPVMEADLSGEGWTLEEVIEQVAAAEKSAK